MKRFLIVDKEKRIDMLVDYIQQIPLNVQPKSKQIDKLNEICLFLIESDILDSNEIKRILVLTNLYRQNINENWNKLLNKIKL